MKILKAGFIQTEPEFGQVANNCQRVADLLEKADADLMVLPELFTTGYQFTDREEVAAFAETIPDGPTTGFLLDLARDLSVNLVAGLAEREGKALYNSAVMVGPGGYLGKYRKAHIFDAEKDLFEPGNLPLPVFDIGQARVGIMICFDWRFPETARTLALNDADVIAHPANLVLPHCPSAMVTRCLENRVFAITADRVGREQRVPGEPLKFIGQSQVVDPDGNILYRASTDGEEMKVVAIDIDLARNKNINPRNHLFQDRREDLYRL